MAGAAAAGGDALSPESPGSLMIRRLSRAPPEGMMGVHHSEGLDYLIYRFKKEVQKGEDGAEYLTRDAFLSVLSSVVETLEEKCGMTTGHPPADEQSVKLVTVFDTFDRAHEGRVQMSEFLSGLCVMLEGSEDERLEFAFHRLDADQDGVVSQKEFLAFFKDYFTAKLQVDHRRQLSEDRWRVIRGHLQMAFRGSDRNKDGTVDIKEFVASVRADPDHPFSLILDSFHCLHDSVAQSPGARRRSSRPAGPAGAGGSSGHRAFPAA
eukprot:TRINITY_DN51567_c0_g1_i1.p1 TRINITY_DN51567_c0_g1~~TRINITY_DN51567_c0_g1_i1.p1  ORF type:complete len:292 (+),score=71.24 TRINITY_DN51567_c0_g1_i1:82-876(+)